MLDQDKGKLNKTLTNKKMPLDVRVVVWLEIISSLMHFIIVGLLIIGIAHSPSNNHRDVLFNTVCLSTNLSTGTYSFSLGLACLVGAYGLWQGYRFGWWFVLIFSIYNISDSALMFSDYPITTTIAICFSLGIIAWLIYRRQLYKIGIKSEELEKGVTHKKLTCGRSELKKPNHVELPQLQSLIVVSAIFATIFSSLALIFSTIGLVSVFSGPRKGQTLPIFVLSLSGLVLIALVAEYFAVFRRSSKTSLAIAVIYLLVFLLLFPGAIFFILQMQKSDAYPIYIVGICFYLILTGISALISFSHFRWWRFINKNKLEEKTSQVIETN